jgi:hypothetical protein
VLPFDLDVAEVCLALFVDIEIVDAHEFSPACRFPVQA